MGVWSAVSGEERRQDSSIVWGKYASWIGPSRLCATSLASLTHSAAIDVLTMRNMKSKSKKIQTALIKKVPLASLAIATHCTPFYEKRLLDRTEDTERRPHSLMIEFSPTRRSLESHWRILRPRLSLPEAKVYVRCLHNHNTGPSRSSCLQCLQQ